MVRGGGGGGGGVTSTSVEKLHSGVVSVGGGFVGSEKKIKRNILITHENVHIIVGRSFLVTIFFGMAGKPFPVMTRSPTAASGAWGYPAKDANTQESIRMYSLY